VYKKLKEKKFFKHVLPVKMPRSRVQALAHALYCGKPGQSSYIRHWPVIIPPLSQRASYIGAIQADQTVESDHSDLLVQWGTRLPGHVLLQV
jgi:hypothetical protein